MADPDALAAFVRAHDPDRFLCALFAPPARRPALFALIAFNHELARAREAARNPIAVLIRLQWWRDAVEEAAAGAPPRQHEVALPLHAALRTGALDAQDLRGLIDAREIEAEEAGIPTEAAFDSYLRGTAGALAVAAGRLLGAPPADLPGIAACGVAYGLAGVLRSVAAHAAQGRCLLPADRLAAIGLSPESVIGDPGLAAPIVRGMAAEVLNRLPGSVRGAGSAAALPVVLARRDLARLAGGRPVPRPRGLGDRLAVTWAGLRGQT